MNVHDVSNGVVYYGKYEDGEEWPVRLYRMREEESPFLESIVTFQVGPNVYGGTRLRIIHHLVDARSVRRTPPAANNNWPVLMLAA